MPTDSISESTWCYCYLISTLKCNTEALGRAFSAKRLVAVLTHGAVHATLHDRVTAVDRGCAATGADRLDDRADPSLKLAAQSHFERSRGVAQISERGSVILRRGPQCDEVGRDLKGVALVDAATVTAGLQLERHL